MSETNSKIHNGVLLMRGGIIDMYIPSYSTTVFSFKLSSDIYAEMEIKNIDLATKSLFDFFTVNKIPPTEFVFIMQTPLFRKEFPIAPQEKLESSINLYLDYIPFDSVLSKRIKSDAGVLIIAANGDLIQSLRKMFSSVSSTIECVTALEGLTIFPKGGLSVLTQVSADTIFKNISLIKQESFSLTPQRSVEGFEVVEEDEEKKEKSTLPFIIPIFVILVIVLVVVYMKSNGPAPTVSPQNNVPITISPTPGALSAPTSTPPKTVPTIKITTATSQVAIRDALKVQLTAEGFTNIIEDSIADVPNARTFVIYSPTLSATTKANIQTLLKKSIPTITEDPTRESSYDAIIVLGK